MKQRHLSMIVKWYSDYFGEPLPRKTQLILVNKLQTSIAYYGTSTCGHDFEVVNEIYGSGAAYSIHTKDKFTGKWKQQKWVS